MGVQADDDAVRVEDLDQFVGDALGDALLHREPARVLAHQPGEFGKPDDRFVAQAADISGTDERQRM